LNPILYFLKDLRKTGAIAPSSKFLANDITELLRDQLQQQQKPIKILELGPGTGTLTKAIISAIRPTDTLDLVEINPHFTRMLRRNFPQPNVQVHYTDFLEFTPDYCYDYIFSSIPYESIPEEISKKLWEKKLSCCCVNGKITYYKYFNFNHFRCKYEKNLVRDYCIDERIVFRNLPPAKLFTLLINRSNENVLSNNVSRIPA